MTVDIKFFYIIRIKHSINTVSDMSLLPKCQCITWHVMELICNNGGCFVADTGCVHTTREGEGFFLHNNMLGYICLIFKSQKHWWVTESFPLCSNIPFSVFASNLLIIWIKLSQFGSWLDKWCFFKLVSSALWLINIQKLC